MKQPLFLKRYLYCIPASSLVLQARANNNNFSQQHMPLLKAEFDFENGRLHLQVEWHFMRAISTYPKAPMQRTYKGRMMVTADLYPAQPIDLSEEKSDGFTLVVDGTIGDGVYLKFCSGLLTIFKISDSNAAQWALKIFLYDLEFEEYEIKFKLPVYV